MTRTELVKFLTDNYEPDEQLLWQTMCFDDVADLEGATEELWNNYLASLDSHNPIADGFSWETRDAFGDFILDPEPEDDN